MLQKEIVELITSKNLLQLLKEESVRDKVNKNLSALKELYGSCNINRDNQKLLDETRKQINCNLQFII